MRIRIGTRGSALALAQANDAARRLGEKGCEVELVIISTEGDRVTDRSFSEVGAFGVFVREIETALMAGRIDVAVHSYKDLPSRGPDELVIAAIPEREDPADVLLIRADAHDAQAPELPVRHGARVGTSAMRRRALLLDARPDLRMELLRGNVPTRLRALANGAYDAIVLAAAGLTRLGREGNGEPLRIPDGIHVERLDPARFVPAPSQGAIALQVRAHDTAVRGIVAQLDDPSVRLTVSAERIALALADGGCTLPFGAWCTQSPDGVLTLLTALGHEDGTVSRGRSVGRDPVRIAADGWSAVSAGIPV